MLAPLKRATIAVLVSLPALGLGCSESNPAVSGATGTPNVPGNPTPSTSTPPTSKPVDGGVDGAPPTIPPHVVCGKVQHLAAGVEEVAENGVAPAPSGGAISPGRYALFQIYSYIPEGVDGGGPTGYFARKTLLISEGNTFAFLESDGNTTDGVGQSTVTGGTFTTQKTDLVLKQVCPEDTNATTIYPYSASPSRIALRRGKRWEIYQRQ